MKNGSYKEIILMAAMEEGYITTHALGMLKDHQKYIRQTICDLTREGYLADRRITHTVKKRKYIIKYKAITKKGIEFVCKKYSDKYTYLNYIPLPLPEFHIVRSSTSDTLYNHLQSINASVLFAQTGIRTVCITGSDIKEGLSFKEMVYMAKKQDRIQNGTEITLGLEDAKNNYIHSRDLYPLFKMPEDEKQQLIFTQQIGFLIDKGESYIVYSAKKTGVKISHTMLKRVRACFKRYTLEHHINVGMVTLNRGIILADTPTEWLKSFKNNLDPKNNMTIDKMFDDLYLLPVCRDAIYVIDKIMYYKEELSRIVQEVLLNYDYDFNLNRGLMYKNRNVVIGIDMNLHRLNSIYNSLRRDPDRKYTIVCAFWQEKYYRMVFHDNVEYYCISEDLLCPN